MSETTTSGAPVLLDKTIKAALAFASRDQTRPILTGVRVTPTCVEATDSYRLVRITHAENVRPMDFPHERGKDVPPVSDIPPEGVIIPAEAIKRALQHMPRRAKILPILEHIAVNVDGADVRLHTNDLDTESVHHVRAFEGKYPDFKELLGAYAGDEAGARIAFDPRLLKQVCDAFVIFGATYVVAEFRSPLKPAIFRATNAAKQEMTALLMPVRTEETTR